MTCNRISSRIIAYVLHILYELPMHIFINIIIPYVLYKNMHAPTVILAFLNAARPIGNVFAAALGIIIDILTFNKRRSYISIVSVIVALFMASRMISAGLYFMPTPEMVIVVSIGFYSIHKSISHFWMELIRRFDGSTANLNKTFSSIQSLSYALSVIATPMIGMSMDKYHGLHKDSWSGLFVFVSIITGICMIVISLPLLISGRQQFEQDTPSAISKKNMNPKPLLDPLKEIWSAFLLPKFLWFSIVFFICGSGIMMISPLYVVYFNAAHYSHAWVGFFRGSGQGLGTALGLFIGHKASEYIRSPWLVLAISSTISAGFFFYLFCTTGMFLPYLTWAMFTIYGTAVGTAEYIWLMSPIWISHNKDSIPFARANSVVLGIRGMTIPFVGAFLHDHIAFDNTLLASIFGLLIPGALLSLYLYYSGIHVSMNTHSSNQHD